MTRAKVMAFLLAVTGLFLSSCAVDIKHQRVEDVAPAADQGVVILGIQGNTLFERIVITGDRRTEVGYEMLKVANPFVVFTLPAGKYRFDRVWLNSYLYVPVVEDDDDAEVWDFEVKAGYLNYLGNIVVTQQTGGGYFLRMHNRSSEALEFLEAKYPQKLAEFRLRNAVTNEDDFLSYVARHKGYPNE